MALGSTQPLTEISTRNLPGGKGRTARRSDNLTAISQPYGPPRPVTFYDSFARNQAIKLSIAYELSAGALLPTMRVIVHGCSITLCACCT
jgi:hypothetical protein